MMVKITYNIMFRICRNIFYVVFFYDNEVSFSIFLEFIYYYLIYIHI